MIVDPFNLFYPMLKFSEAYWKQGYPELASCEEA